jgi:hypothetical protein
MMNRETDPQQAISARREDLVIQELSDETLVYDLRKHKAHCLNQTAAFVWNHCNGQTQATEIAALMEREWHKPVGEDVVWLALKQLYKADLLEKVAAGGGEKMNVSRRAVMRKLGTAAALTLPMVTSVVSPTAAQSGSIPSTCQVCTTSLGQPTVLCPTECENVIGGCWSNNSCSGQGQFFGCRTCLQCKAENEAENDPNGSYRAGPLSGGC